MHFSDAEQGVSPLSCSPISAFLKTCHRNIRATGIWNRITNIRTPKNRLNSMGKCINLSSILFKRSRLQWVPGFRNPFFQNWKSF
jgi:hypothetical protein